MKSVVGMTQQFPGGKDLRYCSSDLHPDTPLKGSITISFFVSFHRIYQSHIVLEFIA